MNFTKILFFILSITVLNSGILFSQIDGTSHTNTSLDQRLRIGEEFTYLVKYAFLNLGEVRIKVYAKEKLTGKTIYKTIAYIDSYEGLPFVDMHQIYESWIDSNLCPVFFQALIFSDEDTSYTKYFFKDDNKVHVLRGKLNKEKPWVDTVVTLGKKYQDGLSLLYFARFGFVKRENTIIPTYVNEDTSTTMVNYYKRKEKISIDALGYDIDCVRLDGRTNFTGIFGLTGYFEGWFSNDESYIPITADLQVILGDVTAELINWNKKKWQPPAYNK